MLLCMNMRVSECKYEQVCSRTKVSIVIMQSTAGMADMGPFSEGKKTLFRFIWSLFEAPVLRNEHEVDNSNAVRKTIFFGKAVEGV